MLFNKNKNVAKPKEIEDAVYAEQVRMLYDSMLASVAANVATSVLFVVAQWFYVDHKILFWWFCISLTIIVARAVLLYFYKKNATDATIEFWGGLFNVGSTASALMLGSAGIFLFPTSEPVGQVMCTLVLVGMTSGALSSLSVGRYTFALYAFSALVPLMVRLAYESTTLTQILFFMTLLSLVFTLRSARYIFVNSRHNNLLRIEAVTREAELKQVTRNHERHISRTPVGVVEWDNEYIIREWNSACQRIFDYKKTDVIGKSLDEILFAGTDKTTSKDRLSSLVNTPEVSQDVFNNMTPDGRRFICEWSSTPLTDIDGNVKGVVSIINDITDKSEANSKIMAAKEEAERANMAKSEFLSRMSHELRTPMNSILGFGQLLEISTDDLSEQQKDYIKKILNSGKHLLALIDEVLDVSMVDSGEIELHMQPSGVDGIVESTLAMVAPLAEKQGVALTTVETGNYYVLADEKRLLQVLINLLTNAIKYNHKEGKVTVSCSPMPDNLLRISISDTGIGIAEQDIPRVFEPFTRVGDSKINTEGVGMGLSIAKSLVQLMGGTIGCESQLNGGSTFWIELPLISATNNQEVKIDNSSESQLLKDDKKKLILYVEDNEANQRLMEDFLEFTPDLQLLVADDAESGIELAREQLPDIILMDINLPGMNGFEALSVLKSDQRTAGIPVYAVTAHAMSDQVQEGQSAGFSEYITKPINFPRLIELLTS